MEDEEIKPLLNDLDSMGNLYACTSSSKNINNNNNDNRNDKLSDDFIEREHVVFEQDDEVTDSELKESIGRLIQNMDKKINRQKRTLETKKDVPNPNATRPIGSKSKTSDLQYSKKMRLHLSKHNSTSPRSAYNPGSKSNTSRTELHERAATRSQARASVSLSTNAENRVSEKERQLALLQAAAFISDALRGRSIMHNIDHFSLTWLYWLYYHPIISKIVTASSWIYICVAFIEKPRLFHLENEWLCLCLEISCLVVITGYLLLKYLLIKNVGFLTKWNIAIGIALCISFTDIFLFESILHFTFRIRRYLRPIFCINTSSTTKQMLKNVSLILPNMVGVTLVLLSHIVIFAYFGILLFQGTEEGNLYFTTLPNSLNSLVILLTTANHPDVMLPAYKEHKYNAFYFISFLLIGYYFLLNIFTAFIYYYYRNFVTKSLQRKRIRRHVGLRAAFEMLNALTPHLPTQVSSGEIIEECLSFVCIIKKEYIPFYIDALHTHSQNAIHFNEFYSLFNITFFHIERKLPAIPKPLLPSKIGYKLLSYVRTRPFLYFRILICFATLCFSLFLLPQHFHSREVQNHIVNKTLLAFSVWYGVESLVVIVAYGPTYYFSMTRWHYFDTALSVILILSRIITALVPSENPKTVKTINSYICVVFLLLSFRLIRHSPFQRQFHVVGKIFSEFLFGNASLSCIFVAIFYFFAVLGQDLFANTINSETIPLIKDTDYWKNGFKTQNFDDFFSSIICLWDLMVVNNWFILMEAYVIVTNPYARIYFVAWFATSVLVLFNLIIAWTIDSLVTEWKLSQTSNPHFHGSKWPLIMRKQKQNTETWYKLHMNETHVLRMKDSVVKMFADELEAPSDQEIASLLKKHHLIWPIISIQLESSGVINHQQDLGVHPTL